MRGVPAGSGATLCCRTHGGPRSRHACVRPRRGSGHLPALRVEVLHPVAHEWPPRVEQVAPRIRRFGLLAYVRERSLHHRPRVIRPLGRPVPERRPEAMRNGPDPQLLKQLREVLVDERDTDTAPRVLLSIEHAVQDGSVTRAGERRVVSKRVLYVELGADGEPRHLHYAPYLDYRPLAEEEPAVDALLERPECAWIDRDLEQKAQAYAVAHVVPGHLREVREARLALISKTEAAVKDRLRKEISFWDSRAEQLKLDEEAGKTGARLNSGEARRRADTLQLRLQKRLAG